MGDAEAARVDKDHPLPIEDSFQDREGEGHDLWTYWKQFVPEGFDELDVEEEIRLAQEEEADRFIERMEEYMRWNAENLPRYTLGRGWDDLDQGCK